MNWGERHATVWLQRTSCTHNWGFRTANAWRDHWHLVRMTCCTRHGSSNTQYALVLKTIWKNSNRQRTNFKLTQMWLLPISHFRWVSAPWKSTNVSTSLQASFWIMEITLRTSMPTSLRLFRVTRKFYPPEPKLLQVHSAGLLANYFPLRHSALLLRSVYYVDALSKTYTLLFFFFLQQNDVCYYFPIVKRHIYKSSVEMLLVKKRLCKSSGGNISYFQETKHWQRKRRGFRKVAQFALVCRLARLWKYARLWQEFGSQSQ